VGVPDAGEAERVEQLQVQRHRGDPLLAADDQSDPHQVVVDGVREMIGRQPRLGVAALQDHRVVAVAVQGQLAANRVGEAHPCPGGARGTEPDHVRIPGGQPLGHLLLRGVAPHGPRPVVAGQGACRPLPGGDLLQVFLGREARIRLTLAEQHADVGQVGARPPGLGVRPVVTVPVIFVRADGEVGERLGELLGRALGHAGLVGVLQSDQVAAAGVPGDVRVDGGHVHAADVQEAGRAGREPGDLGALGQVARRVTARPVLGLGQVRREQGINEMLAQHERAAPCYA
jgi:hypothetical protein